MPFKPCNHDHQHLRLRYQVDKIMLCRSHPLLNSRTPPQVPNGYGYMVKSSSLIWSSLFTKDFSCVVLCCSELTLKRTAFNQPPSLWHEKGHQCGALFGSNLHPRRVDKPPEDVPSKNDGGDRHSLCDKSILWARRHGPPGLCDRDSCRFTSSLARTGSTFHDWNFGLSHCTIFPTRNWSTWTVPSKAPLSNCKSRHGPGADGTRST